MSEHTPHPIRDLESFTQQGVDVTPLPPSEVRRLGDRRRRRTHAMAAVGGVAAIAIIATPFALWADGSHRAAPTPGPATNDSSTTGSPTPTTSTTSTSAPAPADRIPADYPLAAGWPDPSQAEQPDKALEGPSRDVQPLGLTACGRTLAEPDSADFLGARWHNVEDGRSRDLRVFATAAQAVAYVDEVGDFFRACPSSPNGGGPEMRNTWRVADTGLGGQSVGIVGGYTFQEEPSLGFNGYQVIRLGRAVLTLGWTNEGSDDGRPVAKLLQPMTDEAAEPIASMCMFTEAGCDGSATSEPSGSGSGSP